MPGGGAVCPGARVPASPRPRAADRKTADRPPATAARGGPATAARARRGGRDERATQGSGGFRRKRAPDAPTSPLTSPGPRCSLLPINE